MDMKHSDKMSLLRFVCNAAWQDVQVDDRERRHILTVAERMGLNEDDLTHVEGWLKKPPPIESVDPTDIPIHLGPTFLRELEAVIASDGDVSDEESEMLSILREFLDPEA